MKKIILLILVIIVLSSNVIAGPPMRPVPKQVTSAEITVGTETKLRSYSPADVVSFISTHGGADAFTVKVDAAATAAYLYNAGSGAVRAGTNVTIDDNGDYITVNASLAGGAVDTEGTLNADEIAVMHDLDTIKSLTEAEFKTAYNMEAGTDYLAPAGDGGSLTNLNGENIQDDTIDDDSLDFSDITLDDFVSAENDYISVATDDTFDFTRNDAGSVTITASDDDAIAGLTILPGGAAAMILGGASTTTITVITDGGSMTLDGLIAIGTDPADAGVIRLENATALAWEDATEATITHVDDTGFIINLALEIDGALNADGAVSLGDGGDNFSVASDGIDIDTSGNVSNAGTIACGKVTSSAAFESATGLFDVTGAAAITVGSADVTAITLQTDDTGDGTDLVLPAQSVNGSEMLNNTVTATQISATVTLADGDVFDFSGITHTGSTDEGLALPTWANVTPTSDKAWISWDGTNQILKVYDGGWVSISPSGAPTDATYLTLSVDATLSDERVLTESTQGIDFTDGGAGSTLTVSLDFTEVDSFTLSDGANATNVITFDVSGTDTTLTAGSDIVTFSDDVSAETFIPSEAAAAAGEFGYNTNAFSWFANSEDLTMTASSNTWTFGTGTDVTLVDFGAIGLAGGSFDASDGNITNVGSIALDSITADGSAITIGGGTETVAVNSSDWDISTTGAITGVAFDANGTGNTLTNINAADHADEDWGDFSVSSGSFTLDADVVGTAEMADADHGHVAWSSGSATVEDFAVSAEATVADDIAIRFGGAATDWYAEFDDSVDDQMLWHTTSTAAVATTDPMFEILADFGTANGTGMTANQQIFGVAKGTQASNVSLMSVDEDGDLSINGSFTSSGSGDSYIELSNNSGGLAPSGYRAYFETDGSDVFSYSLNGSEKRFANLEDAQTISGAKTFSYDIIMSEVADHQSTPGAGYGYLWVKNDTPSSLIFTDDAGTDYDLSATAAGDVESVGDCTSGACLDGSSDGGSYVRVYDGDSHYAEFQVPDISGNVTYTFPTSTETIASLEGSDTQVIFNSGGTAYAGDAGFVINSTTDALTLGENGQDGSLILYNESGGTDYNLIMQPGIQSAAATITFPGSTSTLATLGLAETFSGLKTFTAGIDIDEDVDIDFNAADEEMVITNSAEYGAGGSQVTIDNADADVGAQMYLLNLDYSADDGQANADYIIAQDSGGTVFILGQDGDITTTDGDYTTTNGAITAGGAITGGTVTDGTVTLAGDGTITGISAGGYPNDSVLFADLDDDGNYGPFTGTWIFTGGTLVADAIDGSGAVDFDIGSADITDVTIITDGGADSLTIGNNADLDFGITFDSDTDDLTLNWDEDNSEFELNAPNYRFGANADEDILLTFDSDSNDGTINWNEDNATFQFSNVLANTPQAKTYNADDDSETVGSDITSSVVLITTDNDSTDETVDIQDGTVSGQMVTFICVSGCDGTDDGVDIDVETDSTCTGCDSSGIYALGTNGDSVTIVWDGTNSAWYEVGYKIQ